MKLAVITPVGPGHQAILPMAALSVVNMEHGCFHEIIHVIVNDTEGILGRSKARNQGMIDADWYFFLDADDVIMSYAARMFSKNKKDFAAVFGSVMINGRVSPRNVWPCELGQIRKHKGLGTLSMGFFVKAEVARDMRFNEDLDKGEDFDFYMRLPSFYKGKLPLTSINSKIPSAGGPRGYEDLDWHVISSEIVDKYLP